LPAYKTQVVSRLQFVADFSPRKKRVAKDGWGAMMDSDSGTPGRGADCYRAEASRLRALIPLMHHAAARDHLDLLAVEYEKLADFVEASIQHSHGR
jgi:hypothetical protein